MLTCHESKRYSTLLTRRCLHAAHTNSRALHVSSQVLTGLPRQQKYAPLPPQSCQQLALPAQGCTTAGSSAATTQCSRGCCAPLLRCPQQLPSSLPPGRYEQKLEGKLIAENSFEPLTFRCQAVVQVNLLPQHGTHISMGGLGEGALEATHLR